ncbi:hypothetical protein ANCCAN_27825 [Ancylostoma caninum]|uniref:Uncharacterized protein n=1 Tax=Ancylostoma caninum TaxID=29170 RepID=A0A368F485_ANCCA|nr:hypothetical protein ANCCAN_27825 [Ancylostoma caninum]
MSGVGKSRSVLEHIADRDATSKVILWCYVIAENIILQGSKLYHWFCTTGIVYHSFILYYWNSALHLAFYLFFVIKFLNLHCS